MQRQDLTVHHNTPLELAKSRAGVVHRAQWWGQAFTQVMKACDERARHRDEDGTGKPCAVGEAVAGASVSERCWSLAAVKPPLPGEARHQPQLLRGPGWWVWRGVQKWVLWSCVGLNGSGTTSSRCSWSLFQWAELGNSTKPWLSKALQAVLWAWPSPVEVDAQRWSLH